MTQETVSSLVLHTKRFHSSENIIRGARLHPDLFTIVLYEWKSSEIGGKYVGHREIVGSSGAFKEGGD